MNKEQMNECDRIFATFLKIALTFFILILIPLLATVYVKAYHDITETINETTNCYGDK